MKKFLSICLLLSLLSLPLTAKDAKVIWSWDDEKPATFYRYQLDSTNEEGWTTLDGSIKSVSTVLDISTDHTFYIQGSHDGATWSEVSEYTLLAEKAENVVAPESSVVREDESTATESEATTESVDETASVEDVATSKSSSTTENEASTVNEEVSDIKLGLLASVGVATDYDVNITKPGVRYNVAFEVRDIVRWNYFSMGFRTDLGITIYPYETDWNNERIKNSFFNPYSWWYDTALDTSFVFAWDVVDNVSIYNGYGLGFSLFNQRFLTEANQVAFGHSLGNVGYFSTAFYLKANLGAKYQFNDLLTFGGEVNYRFYVPASKHNLSLDFVVGINF